MATALIAVVTGLLFTWWVGVVAFLVGLALILRKKGAGPSWLNKMLISNSSKSGEWLEEWHDDMRRRQDGPYEWRD